MAEVQRDVMKQLGVDISGRLGTGTAVVDFNTRNPFTLVRRSAPRRSFLDLDTNLGRVEATIRAMERAGVIRTLAEPNLSAISGESANFLAGGEFPVITGSTCNPPGSFNCTASVEFKKFGVSLGFTPIVLSEGRISLKVITEVSELSTEGALVSQGRRDVPSLKVRRADTTLEIPSGGSLAMAGLISEQTKQTHQWLARTGAAAGARHAVPQPRLCESANRTDGAGGRRMSSAPSLAEGLVATRRRLCGCS